LLPWYGLRFQLLGRVVQSWIPWQLRYDWSRGTDASGWGTPIVDTVTADEYRVGLDRTRNEYQAILHNWQPGSLPTAALRELLEECRTHKIAVKLILMPEGAEFRTWYSVDMEKRLKIYLAYIAKDYSIAVLDCRNWLPDDAFTDGHHQLRRGAEAFTIRLTRDVILPWVGGQP
jgi:hypothetical protein